MNYKLSIPDKATHIIRQLEAQGFNAYVVGGCVRDLLLGLAPEDWDITTNATPTQVIACFKNYTTIPTGLQHGTVTIVMDSLPFEITTFRIDGSYSDYRRPESVSFTTSLKEDLSRRDFTINAIAYNPKEGLLDYYGGLKDLEEGIIRAVGEPDKRFGEDALRVLRGVRFASQLGFAVEDSTKASMLKNRGNLFYIAAERIQTELSRTLIGGNIHRTLLDYHEIITTIIPELKPAVGFGQQSEYHYLDVYRHIAKTVGAAPPELVLRLTMLMHDVGKPYSYQEDPDGTRHFAGHDKVGETLTRRMLARLKYSNEIKVQVITLVTYHDMEIPATQRVIRRRLNCFGQQRLQQLLEVQRADALGKIGPARESSLKSLEEVKVVLEEVLLQQQCFSQAQLAVDGRDIINLGVLEGRRVGEILGRLLDLVVEGQLENQRELLLAKARKLISQNPWEQH